jgi:hypothetical protein
MASLSALIAVPLMWSAKFLTISHHALQMGIGAGTMGFGGYIIYRAYFDLSLLV